MDIKNVRNFNQASPLEQNNNSASPLESDASGLSSTKDSLETYSGDSFFAVNAKSSPDFRSMNLGELMNDVSNFLTDQGPMNVQDPVGGIFGFMMEYQKMMNTEARQDRQISKASGQLELLSKEDKLTLENEKIDDLKQEAGERFSESMGEASYEMILGIAGRLQAGDTQQDIQHMSSMLDALKQHASQMKDELLQNADEQSGKQIVSRYQHLASMFGNDDK